MKKDINTKDEAVTREFSAGSEPREREYSFPSLGVSVKATSYKAALEAAKKKITGKIKSTSIKK